MSLLLPMLALVVFIQYTPLSTSSPMPVEQGESESPHFSGYKYEDHPRHRVKRITGGYVAPEGFYTSIVGIRWRDSETKRMRHHCGGSLISAKFVLTAASCFDADFDKTEFDVMAGDWDNTKTEGTEQQMKIAKIHNHPKFTADLIFNIAILELETAVSITDFVSIASMPSRSFNHFNGRLCTSLGWGRTDTEEKEDMSALLQAAPVALYNHTACAAISGDKKYYKTISNSSLCVGYSQGGIGMCDGDIGGPLLCQENDGVSYLVGISSWKLCGHKQYLDVYTKVHAHLHWIDGVINEKDESEKRDDEDETEERNVFNHKQNATESEEDIMSSKPSLLHIFLLIIPMCAPGFPYEGSAPLAQSRVKRIVGGYVAPGEFYTYIVGIRHLDNHTKKMSHHCGGSLISPQFVLTAAHCLEADRNPKNYDIVAGDWDTTETEGTEQQMKVAALHFYPKYQQKQKTLTHDIAIIELVTPLDLTEFVTTISLPSSEFDYFNGRLCSIQGWGATEEGESPTTRLQAAQVVMFDRIRCTRLAGDKENLSRFNFCAGYAQGGIDTCQGDSGGPVVCQENDGITYLTGITSWGIGCGRKNHLGVYTKVAKYLTWIGNVTSSV